MIDILTAGGALLADQWSKHLALRHTASGGIALFGPFQMKSSQQERPWFRHRVGRVLLMLAWFAALAATMLLNSQGWFANATSRFGLGLAFGGAAGNLLDIVQRRAVVDFIDVGGWTVFNLADAAIVAGLLIAFVSEI